MIVKIIGNYVGKLNGISIPQPGQEVEIDPASAQWLIDRGLAEPVKKAKVEKASIKAKENSKK